VRFIVFLAHNGLTPVRFIPDDTMGVTSTVTVLCKLCEKKRAKRACPGVRGDICPSCCGSERENTIDCPLDCVYLQEARVHDHRAPHVPPVEELPNADIKLNEDFVRAQEPLIVWLSAALVRGIESGKAVDGDAREGLEALIKTYRTLESGLIYETRPANPYAAGIQEGLKKSIDELRAGLAEKTGMQTLRDADVLGALVFLQRLELQHSNGRQRGRAFFDFLRSYFPAPSAVGVEA
jgi:hypothetical protein